MTKARTQRGRGALLSNDALAAVRKRQVRNILAKASRGAVLSAREEQIVNEAVASGKVRRTDTERMWLAPSALLRWLNQNGVKISKKNLYETYLSPAATHPMQRSEDGRIHKQLALELIQVVQGRGKVDMQDAIARQQEARARFQAARAAMQELDVAARKGELVPIALAIRVISQAESNFSSELAALKLSLPDELHGKGRQEMGQILEKRFAAALKHVRNVAERLAKAS